MGIFFENAQEEYTIIEDTPLKEIGEVPVTPITCSDRWGCYAYMKMMQATSDEVYSSCFSYYISLIMTDIGMSATAEEVYFKEALMDHVFHVVHDARNEENNETKQKIMCYNTLFNEFKEGLQKYERKVFEYNAKVNDKIYNILSKNGNINQTLISYMKNNKDPEMVVNTNPTKQISIYLTWSEEKLYGRYLGDSATEKVVSILNNVKY